MTPIKLVVFDMAGTTVQDKKEVETCFAKACQHMNLNVNEERILALQGYSKIEVFRLLWDEKIGSEHPEYLENVEVSYDYFRMILEEHYEKNPILPTEGCLEIFEFLRANDIKIALTTGFYRKVVNIILGKLGWLTGLDNDYFNKSGDSIIDLSIASDEVPKGRPEPFMIQKAMNLFGITDAQQVINIGDTPSDLQSGISAGCRLSLGLTNGTHTYEQLKDYPNDGLLGSLQELKEIIRPLI
ncbi:MAG: HAD hydrolase-like protein [Spirosomaceae bacterium]|nr:HAD hydrolase-like protein [Spirosomataceae bacterium]